MSTLRSLSQSVIHRATARGCSLGTAESLTGGLIAASLAGVPGASRVLLGGIVSYDTRIKQRLLAVPQEVIEDEGAVSSSCAVQMAVGARACLGADIAVSATGLAGPGGGTPRIPAGTVFLAITSEQGARAEEHHFTGSRQTVRRKAAKAALKLVLAELGNDSDKMGGNS